MFRFVKLVQQDSQLAHAMPVRVQQAVQRVHVVHVVVPQRYEPRNVAAFEAECNRSIDITWTGQVTEQIGLDVMMKIIRHRQVNIVVNAKYVGDMRVIRVAGQYAAVHESLVRLDMLVDLVQQSFGEADPAAVRSEPESYATALLRLFHARLADVQQFLLGRKSLQIIDQ